jgi:small-conductance mechanosensitive channel
MKDIQKTAAIMIAILLLAVVYGVYRTGQAPKSAPLAGKGKQPGSTAPLVDQTPLKDAQELAKRITSQDEIPYAKEALRLADYQVDLAYEAALHEVRQHPPVLSPEAKEAKGRLDKAQKLVADDEAQMAQLKDALEKTKEPTKKEKLQAQLDDVEADRDLANDEVNDAQEDFRREGGDLEERIQEAKKQHQESQHAQQIPGSIAPPEEKFGLIHRYEQWSALHGMQLDLWRAKGNAEGTAAVLTLQHEALDKKLEAEKEKSPELAHHAKNKKNTPSSTPALPAATPPQKTPTAPASSTAAPSSAASSTASVSTEDLAAAADRKWALAGEQEALATLDKRIETGKEAAANYAKWIDVIASRQQGVVHRALIGVLIILAIILISLYFMGLVDKVLSRISMDRRQVENLRTVADVALRVVALLMILLVIIGPPNQLGTFLGLAGAGLTVALKDFIVGFIGWFVLMGKNGMRLGDWVEINGVSGEVVELGMFHTVLLETGNWTDSGHPTGRRVTFTNSFAIEGHYFNFSTSGQWLWDELQLVLPTGTDPYPVVDAIQKKVGEATSENAKVAETEWKRSARSRDMSVLSAAPAINIKPVIGGVEIAVRYITRANERYQLRARLYQAAVEILGQKPGVKVEAPAEKIETPR